MADPAEVAQVRRRAQRVLRSALLTALAATALFIWLA